MRMHITPTLSIGADAAALAAAARSTLALTNKAAWATLLENLRTAGIPEPELQLARALAWAERKHMRAVARAEARARIEGDPPRAPTNQREGT
jgi:hypothetical protein